MGAHAKARHRAAEKEQRELRRLLDAIRLIFRTLRESSRAAERRVGVSGAQLFVLQKLAAAPAECSVNELAALTLTHQSSVSVVVARLEQHGLVHRQPATFDRRRRLVSLTAKGRAVLRQAPNAAQDELIAGLRRLPASRRRALSEGLRQLVVEMGLGGERASMFFEDEGRGHG